MKRYRVKVTGSDAIGWSFLKNVIVVANKGGVLAEGVNPRLTFPHEVMMIVNTKEDLVSVPGITYIPILQKYNKEELEEMEWDDFRAKMREAGVIGKDRQVMIGKYLELIKDL